MFDFVVFIGFLSLLVGLIEDLQGEKFFDCHTVVPTLRRHDTLNQ